MAPPTEQEAQINQLMARLDALRQEQNQVMTEIKSLLALPKAVSNDLATSELTNSSAEANAQVCRQSLKPPSLRQTLIESSADCPDVVDPMLLTRCQLI